MKVSAMITKYLMLPFLLLLLKRTVLSLCVINVFSCRSTFSVNYSKTKTATIMINPSLPPQTQWPILPSEWSQMTIEQRSQWLAHWYKNHQIDTTKIKGQ